MAEALGQDEAGDRMAALELYNKVLSSLSLGLGQVKRGDTGMADLLRKMEKCVCVCMWHTCTYMYIHVYVQVLLNSFGTS